MKKFTRRQYKIFRGSLLTSLLMIIFSFTGNTVYATESSPLPFSFDFSVKAAEAGGQASNSLQILLILTVISLAPSILIMMTSFTRIIIILHFLRSAMGTQQTPPNQILIGLALFLTLFIMSPTLTKVNTEAIKPYSAGTITQEQAIDRAMKPMREFMFRQVRTDDLGLFTKIAGLEPIKMEDNKFPDAKTLPSRVLIPAFIISELKTAFIIGFLIYIPFIVIDMVVASTLMSMGMMMLPPVMISLPFKLLLFVLVDGWNLIIGQIVKTFQ